MLEEEKLSKLFIYNLVAANVINVVNLDILLGNVEAKEWVIFTLIS